MPRILIVFACLALACRISAAAAPDFTVTDSGGKTHHLYADYVNKGKVLVLEIFFTTCPPCATHAPYWQNLYDSIKNQYPGRVEFMLLTNKSFDLNANVNQYLSAKGLTMPGIGVEGGSLSAVQPYEGNQFGTFYGTPTFVVIAPGSGTVIFDIRGDNPPQTMGLIQQQIQLLLAPVCAVKTFKGDTLHQYSAVVSVPGGASKTAQVANGAFSMEIAAGLPAAPFYFMQPAKNNAPLNGVSTFDLLQINKQILGAEPFSAPWQFIAADANNSGTVSTFDIVEFRKLILGIYDTLPAVPSWVFSPAQDTVSFTGCPAFTAIKKGDVNGNADSKNLLEISERNGRAWDLSIENRLLQAGESGFLRLNLDAESGWQGLQAALRFDPGWIEVTAIQAVAMPDFDDAMWHLSRGRVAISWFSEAPANSSAESPGLFLHVRALRTAETASLFQLERTPLAAEAYDPMGEIHPLAWREPGCSVALAPNPAKGSFVLSVESPLERRVELQIRNICGQVSHREWLQLHSGFNRIDIRPLSMPGGLYTVQVGAERPVKMTWQE